MSSSKCARCGKPIVGGTVIVGLDYHTGERITLGRDCVTQLAKQGRVDTSRGGGTCTHYRLGENVT